MLTTRSRTATLLAAATFIVMTIMCTSVYWQIEQHEQGLIQSQTQLTADQIAIRMEEFFQTRLASAHSVRDELSSGRIASQDAFVDRVVTITANFPGLQAINWVDDEGVIQWVAPVEPNLDAQGKSVLDSDAARPYLREAMETGDTRVTRHLQLLQGGVGFATYIPVPDGPQSTGGFVNLVARIQPMLNVCLARGVSDDFNVLIMQGGAIIYATSDQDVRQLPYRTVATSTLLNQRWELHIAPQPHLIAAGSTMINEVAFVLAILITAAGSWIMRSMLIARSTLRERDEQIASIVDRMPGVAYSYVYSEETGERTAVYFSDLVRLLGPKTAAEVGDDPNRWIALNHPDDDVARRQKAIAAMNGDSDVAIETRMRTDDGYKWMLSLGRVDAIGGGLYRCHGLMLDVDERKRADEALRRSEELQSAIMRSTPDYMLLLDLDGTIQFVNHTVPELSVEQVLGRPIFDFIAEYDHARVRHVIARAMTTREPQTYETTATFGDGPPRTFQSIIGPVIEEGEVASLVEVTRDVTEHRKITQRLWEHEQLLEQAAAIGNIGSWKSDLSGEPGGITWSDPCYTIFGIEPGTFDGLHETFIQFVHPDDRDEIRMALDQCIEQKTSYSVDHRIIRHDGSVRWLHEQAEPICADDGSVVGLIGLCQDITERRRSQEALQMVAEAVSSEVGDAFFTRLAVTLADVLQTSHAFVGRLSDDDPNMIETLAVCENGSIRANFTYSLDQTPCAEVVQQELCMYADRVQSRFPNDALLKELGAEGYAGAPLPDSSGQTIGLLVVIDKSPIENPDLVRSLLRVMGTRAANELERTKHVRLLEQSDERYRAFVEGASDSVWRFTFDPPIDTTLPPAEQARLIYERGILEECNDVCAERYGADIAADVIGRRLSDLRPQPEPTFLAFLESFIRDGYRTQDREVTERDSRGVDRVSVHNSHGVVKGDHLAYVWGTHRDITEKRVAEQRQQLMMRELDHRVKNNLAAVLSLAQQSIRDADSFEQFGASFTGRIAAMSRTHEALASTKWDGVNLRAIVEMSLAPFIAEEKIARWVDGPPVVLPARAAMPVCLTLHELATNAAKHGALHSSNGTLTICWKIEDEAVHLTWQEQGQIDMHGRPEEGLGMRLIRGLIAHEIAGDVKVDFAPEGLSCILRIPLTDSRRSSKVASVGTTAVGAT